MVQAQRYIPGYRGIELRFGDTDGRTGPKDFYVGAAMNTYTMNNNRWVYGFEYLQKNFSYKDDQIPLSQFTVETGFYYNFLSDASKTVFLSIGGSPMVGYELINRDQSLLPDGARIMNANGVIFGGAAAFEMEIYLTDSFVLSACIRERVLFNSSVQNFLFQMGVGAKFIIN